MRSNIPDWSAEDLWRTYVQLTEAEAAFRIHESDLSLRPIWHQRADRVKAHILVCFLAYVLWKTLEQWQRRAGLGQVLPARGNKDFVALKPHRVRQDLRDMDLVVHDQDLHRNPAFFFTVGRGLTPPQFSP